MVSRAQVKHEVEDELKRLRRGQALAHPAVVMQLSLTLRAQLTSTPGSPEGQPDDVLMVVDAFRQVIGRLGRHEQLFARVDFNLLEEHSYPTLTERQESLARVLKCTAKTVRRHSSNALETIALLIASGGDLRTGGRAGWIVPASEATDDVRPANSAIEPRRQEPGLEERLAAAASQSALFGEWAEITNAGEIAVTRLQQTAQQLARDYLTALPLPILEQATEVSGEIFRLLRRHQRPAIGRDLFVVAGYLCALMGWISGDLGNLDAAKAHERTAWLCADTADQSELRAWVRSTQSKTAFWCGRYVDAARMADDGLRYATAGTAGVLLACQAADAWAHAGDHSQAAIALRRAEVERDRQRGADDVGGLFSCGTARQANYTAGVLLEAGSFEDAVAAGDQALSAFEDGDPRAYGTEAQVHINRAIAFALNGSLDGASEALRPVLGMPAGCRLSTLTSRLRNFERFLGTGPLRKSLEAIRLRDELAHFGDEATTSQLEAHPPGRTLER